jgi:glycerol-3-phosphate dehydrogenase
MLLYDHLGGRSRLPRSCRLDLRTGAMAAGLKRELRQGFAYYDCRVDDARLVVLNCQAAADMGALILPRTEVVAGRRLQGQWHVSVRCDGGVRELRARALINAAGPWVRAMHGNLVEREVRHGIRLVKGSHIVLPKLYPGGHAYILQNHDRRVVLAIPYLEQFTLVGTTDVPHPSAELTPQISPEETGYLCEAVNRYFERVASPVDVVATFSGVRPLYDDGNANPSEVTRDYKLLLDEDGAPLLSIYGGKITTHRKLAEHALEKLQPFFPAMARAWTHAKSLPGGDFEDGPRLLQDLMGEYAKLPRSVLLALARRHGTLARVVLGQATTTADLGEHFGADLYAREVDYFVTREWAGCAEDILWRRTKAGIALSAAQQQALSRYVDRLGRLG